MQEHVVVMDNVFKGHIATKEANQCMTHVLMHTSVYLAAVIMECVQDLLSVFTSVKQIVIVKYKQMINKCLVVQLVTVAQKSIVKEIKQLGMFVTLPVNVKAKCVLRAQ